MFLEIFLPGNDLTLACKVSRFRAENRRTKHKVFHLIPSTDLSFSRFFSRPFGSFVSLGHNVIIGCVFSVLPTEKGELEKGIVRVKYECLS